MYSSQGKHQQDRSRSAEVNLRIEYYARLSRLLHSRRIEELWSCVCDKAAISVQEVCVVVIKLFSDTISKEIDTLRW